MFREPAESAEVAIVTGASETGRAISERLAQEGVTIVVDCAHGDKVQEVVSAIKIKNTASGQPTSLHV